MGTPSVNWGRRAGKKENKEEKYGENVDRHKIWFNNQPNRFRHVSIMTLFDTKNGEYPLYNSNNCSNLYKILYGHSILVKFYNQPNHFSHFKVCSSCCKLEDCSRCFFIFQYIFIYFVLFVYLPGCELRKQWCQPVAYQPPPRDDEHGPHERLARSLPGQSAAAYECQRAQPPCPQL